MSDQKQNPFAADRAPNFSRGNGQGRPAAGSALRDRHDRGLVAPEGKDAGGWDAYRRWLTRVQAPDKQRAPLDPGLYTWKGYRNWSEKVRRDWNPDES